MFCSNCGAAITAGGSFCTHCGAPVGVAMAAAGAAAAATNPPLAHSSASAHDAGFWRRLVAYFIDVLIVWIPLGILRAIVEQRDQALGAWLGVLSLVLWWLYFAVQESSEQRATLGKRMLGIVVTDARGERIGFGQATARHFGALLNYATLLIGYMLAGWTSRKQGLHDMVASTYVVNRDGETRFPVWAIVLLALVALSVPLLGIMAAIAIPAYQDYVHRAQVVESLRDALPIKSAYAEHLLTGRDSVTGAVEVGNLQLDIEPIVTPRARITVEDGLIMIAFTDAAAPRLAGTRLALEPFIEQRSGRTDIGWICGQQSLPTRTARRLVQARADDRTDVPMVALPASCRATR